MAYPLVKVVVDCSLPDREAEIAYTQDQVEAVLKLRMKGDITSEQAAQKLVDLAERASQAADLPDRVTVVPLTKEEIADRDARKAEAERAAAEPVPLTTAQKLVDVIAAAPELSDATKQALQEALAPTLSVE